MNATVLAFVGYVFLTLILLVAIVSSRTLIVMGGKKQPNEFKPDASDAEGSFLHRLTRAHANVVECFPFMGGLLLLAIAMGKSVITDPLALYLILARVAQTLTHLASTSALAVQIRFAFFLVQVGICLFWCSKFISLMLG